MTYQYIAGFFDGEGCIIIEKRQSHRLVVDFSQKYIKVLGEIKKFLGYGKIKKKSTGNIYRLRFKCNDAKKILKKLIPFLCVKKLQARFALQFQDYRQNNSGRGKRVPQKEWQWREMHRQLIMRCNHNRPI